MKHARRMSKKSSGRYLFKTRFQRLFPCKRKSHRGFFSGGSVQFNGGAYKSAKRRHSIPVFSQTARWSC